MASQGLAESFFWQAKNEPEATLAHLVNMLSARHSAWLALAEACVPLHAMLLP